MNQNEVDTNCEMFCQTIKCECSTVGLILFCVWIYSCELSRLPKALLLVYLLLNLFLKDKQHYLVISTGTSEEPLAVGYC